MHKNVTKPINCDHWSVVQLIPTDHRLRNPQPFPITNNNDSEAADCV